MLIALSLFVVNIQILQYKVVQIMIKLKRNNHGFTLIEVVVALALLVLMGGFAISSLASISQARMRESAQTLKSEFEVTRNLAKTHGGQAVICIQKVQDGLLIIRTGQNLTTDETSINDKEIALFYKLTGDDEEYQLGINDSSEVTESTLMVTFAQTNGEIIGPHMIDYIILSNGNKNYKMIVQQKSGMMYYDYEIDEDTWEGNEEHTETAVVAIPRFIINGTLCETITIDATGSSVQPELSYDARNIKIGGVYRAVNSGTYTIIFTLKDPYSTIWADNTIEPKTLVWEIR
jgi:prepilin-type N-terminal cleavage/methylation domain-containing protein